MSATKEKPVKEVQLEDLRLQQRKFVEEYVANNWNATKAAKSAGYKQPHVQGCQLLKDLRVKEVVDRLIRAQFLTSDQVLARYSEMATAEPNDFVSPDGKINRKNYIKKSYLVKEIEISARKTGKNSTKLYASKLKLHDAQAALEKIGRARGLFSDKVEVSGTNGAAIEFVVNLSKEEMGATGKKQ